MGLGGKFRKPRLLLGALMMGVGAAAYATSALLLRLGVTAMWLRYAVATIVAYVLFVTVLAALARWYHRKVALPQPAGQTRDSPSLLELFDPGVGELFSTAEDPAGCLITILGVILAVVGFVVAFFVLNAAGLVAELALDAVVVGVAWRRLQRSLSVDWTHVVAKTISSGMVVLLVITIGAAVIQHMVPGAITIGDVIRGGPVAPP